MIYDGFLFFNELDLLELRLHELAAVVDRFVIVEATRTFTNKPKPLYFQENRKAFDRFGDKIIYVVVDDLPAYQGPWGFEDYQRNSLARGLAGCRPDDIVMLSDVDEIPRSESVRAAAESMRFSTGAMAAAWHRALKNRAVIWTFRNWFKKRHPFVTVFEHRCYGYFLNCAWGDSTLMHGTRMTHYRDLSCARDLRRWKGKVMPDAGWHFSYMGGVERIQAKIEAYSHQEFNIPDYASSESLTAALEAGKNFIAPNRPLRIVPIDDSYPVYLRENLARFSHLMRPAKQAPEPPKSRPR